MRFVRVGLAWLILMCGSSSGAAAACLTLSPGHPIRAHIMSREACVAVTVDSGSAAQLSADQPVDLEFRVSGAFQSEIDEFEFGEETLTLPAAGAYQIMARPVAVSDRPDWNLSISWTSISSQSGERWRLAEISATEAKQKGTAENIAKSLALWKEIGDASRIGKTYLKEGDRGAALQDRPRARAAYEEALRFCVQASDFRCAAEASNNSGVTASQLGDLDAAFQRLREASSYWEKVSSPLLAAKTLSGLGLLLWQSGDLDEALKAMQSAQRVLRGRDPDGYARVLNNLGLCYQSLTENVKAIAYFQSALAIFAERHQPVVRVRYNLGRSYMLLGNLPQAESTLQGAFTEANRTSDLAGRADTMNVFGQTLLRMHRGAEARDRLTEALALERQVRSKRGEATALHYLGVEANERGDREEGRRYLSGAAQIRREAGLRDDASESIYALARLEHQAGNLARAEELGNQAVALIEEVRNKVPSGALRASYYSRKRRFFDLLTDIAMAGAPSTGPAKGFLMSEQAHGRSLLDLLSSGATGARAPTELVDRLAGLRRQIAVLSTRLTDPDPPRAGEATRRELDRQRELLRRRIELLLGEAEETTGEIRQAVANPALGHPLTSVAELQAGLPSDSAVLEYYLGEERSYLWLVLANEIRSFGLPPRAVIEALASRTADRFGRIQDRRQSPSAQAAFEADRRRLSNLLLGSLAGFRLPSRLVLVLDGVLNRVPMEALQLPGSRGVIGLTLDVVRASSASQLLAARPPQPIWTYPQTVLAVVDPVYASDDPRVQAAATSGSRHPGLARLPFTTELEVLNSLVPAARRRVLRGFDASPGGLFQLRPGDFGVLHFSTHAFIDDRIPELSRVALSLVDRRGRAVDGYLHPYQFADLRLNRSIVALSSCETALGKEVLGEGLAGFSDSLFAAGASQLVLSLTAVDAESSSAFFAEVYRRFFAGRPGGMEHSITEARRVFARSPQWSDPYYWASYAILGSISEAAPNSRTR